MMFDVFFALIFIFFSLCIICPPIEFINAGFTVESFAKFWLKSEKDDFIRYHIKKTVVNLMAYSFLPIFYALKLLYSFDSEPNMYYIILFLPFLTMLLVVLYWSYNNWSNHPIIKQLKSMETNNLLCKNMAKNISEEFKNTTNKLIIESSHKLVKVIITNSWILKVTTIHVYIAKQCDSVLIVSKSDTHFRSAINRNAVQFITIDVKSIQVKNQIFSIRINALDFEKLQEKVNSPITALPFIVFQKSLFEQFILVFQEQIELNVKYETRDEPDLCIGCMQQMTNVKLQKLCINQNLIENGSRICATCRCKPMWCSECIARWFVSNQNENESESWLDSKCPCPVCRNYFCVLDVCLLQKI